MNASDPSFIVVGHIARAHGRTGEFYIRSLTDHPGTTFVSGVGLHVADPDRGEPDPLFPLLVIDSVRPYRDGFLVYFAGLDGRTAEDLLRGRDLVRPFDELEPPDDDELFHHQLVGLEVVVDDKVIGRVTRVHAMDPVDLIEIRREDGTVLVPFARTIVVAWDLEAGRLHLDPPEGLLEL